MKMSSLLIHIHLPISNKQSSTFHGGAPRPDRAITATGRRSCSSSRCSGPTSSTARRSANYEPPIFDFNYIQSLPTGERDSTLAPELIKKVKMLLRQEMEDVRRLELIDDLQRLGISYHFDEEIERFLTSIHYKYDDRVVAEERDMYSTALGFRLLREHGFPVSQEVFDCFKNEDGEFRSSLCNDARGLVQLYEASFLLTQGEETLELAKEFATSFLERKVDNEDDDEMDDNLLASMRHALELPIHWRIQRPNGRWFIDSYGKRPDSNSIVLELAKLDFNILQSIHQQELKFVSGWWKETGLSEALPFARDRVVECYIWTLGGLYKPQYGCSSRVMATKANLLITIIDDVFDIYATWEELQLFNAVIQRWDTQGMDQLPKYMQMCFLALNNFINEMAYGVLKEQNILIIRHLRKSVKLLLSSWKDLCRSFIQEAQWYTTGHTPTLNEYMMNGWISSSVHVMLSHTFFLITNPIKNEVVESFYKYHDLVRYPAIILRLANDLATSPNEIERGDVPESVQCYMKESGASVEEAREHVKMMILETWKEMNQERVKDSQFSQNFIANAVDLGRMAQYMYELGDGHGIQNNQIKDRISRFMFEPII